MSVDFIQHAEKIGVGGRWPTWVVAPQILGEELLIVAKRAARFLQKVRPGMTRAASLEAVSRGAGMPSWHSLQKLAQALVDDFASKRDELGLGDAQQRAEAMLPAYHMLARAVKDCAPTENQQRGMRVFAERLSVASAVPIEATLNLVARMNDADTWEQLLARRPEDSSEPLYRFVVQRGAASKAGRFVWSAACGKLVEKQDALFQRYHARSAAEQRKCRELVAQLTTDRPDFLEGLLAKAEIAYPGYEDARKRGRVYAEAIERAEALIPDGFKGEVSWLDVDNRFYHRLLYGYMDWNTLFGSRKRAIMLARKQLRLNPNDNLGVRYLLPALLAEDGQLDSARKALKRISHDESVDGEASFVRSLVAAAQGDRREAAEEFLKALFVFPALRDVLMSSGTAPWPAIKEYAKRAVILDRDTLLAEYAAVTTRYREISEWFPALLSHPEVLAEEEALARRFATARAEQQTFGLYKQWLDEAMSASRRLACSFEPTSHAVRADKLV